MNWVWLDISSCQRDRDAKGQDHRPRCDAFTATRSAISYTDRWECDPGSPVRVSSGGRKCGMGRACSVLGMIMQMRYEVSHNSLVPEVLTSVMYCGLSLWVIRGCERRLDILVWWRENCILSIHFFHGAFVVFLFLQRRIVDVGNMCLWARFTCVSGFPATIRAIFSYSCIFRGAWANRRL